MGNKFSPLHPQVPHHTTPPGPKMPFHLNPLEKVPHSTGESDTYLLPTLATIQLRAWLTSPLYRLIYPGPPSTHPSIINANIARHKASLLDDPTCHIISLLHCNEPEVGEEWKVISFVKYHVFRTKEDLEERSDAGTRTWPEGTHVAMVQWFWEKIANARLRYGEKLGPHVDVEILATDPEYQRMGAGRMLMQAVCEEADRLGLPMYLEGSEEGKKLYEACGFRTQEEIWVDLGRWENSGDNGEGWRGEDRGKREEWYCQGVMLRPARK